MAFNPIPVDASVIVWRGWAGSANYETDLYTFAAKSLARKSDSPSPSLVVKVTKFYFQRVMVGSLEGYEAVYLETQQGKVAGYKVDSAKMHLVLWVKAGPYIYTIDGGTDLEQWNENQGELLKVVYSFRPLTR
jgi:hypothetical protein